MARTLAVAVFPAGLIALVWLRLRKARPGPNGSGHRADPRTGADLWPGRDRLPRGSSDVGRTRRPRPDGRSSAVFRGSTTASSTTTTSRPNQRIGTAHARCPRARDRRLRLAPRSSRRTELPAVLIVIAGAGWPATPIRSTASLGPIPPPRLGARRPAHPARFRPSSRERRLCSRPPATSTASAKDGLLLGELGPERGGRRSPSLRLGRQLRRHRVSPAERPSYASSGRARPLLAGDYARPVDADRWFDNPTPFRPAPPGASERPALPTVRRTPAPGSSSGRGGRLRDTHIVAPRSPSPRHLSSAVPPTS